MSAEAGLARLAPRALVHEARSAGRARCRTVGVVLAVILFLLMCSSVAVGDFAVPLVDVMRAVVGLGGDDATLVVLDLRLPRAAVAVVAGLAFGLSGAIFQTLARNTLASPDVIGITTGATSAAVVGIVVFGVGATAIPALALVGALGTAALIYLLAYRRGASPMRLVLVGIGVAAGLEALTTLLLTRARISDSLEAAVWLTGTLSGRGWPQSAWVLVALVVCVPLLAMSGSHLRGLQLNDELATGTGINVERVRGLVLLAAVVLAAAATSAVGPVAFVAFIAAPIARRLTADPMSLTASALTGGVILVGADVVGRTLTGSMNLPVGIVTGLVGAPYLLWLLWRSSTNVEEA